MKLGITTPIVSLNPAGHGEWERAAGPDELVAIAQVAEGLGYHHLTCSEHVAVPTKYAATRGTTYWDPLATLSYLAASTSTIGLATHVLVLGYHHPWAIAKQFGTLTRLSHGRLILGVGVGSLAEEFELLGADFDDRGRWADESLRELHRIWGEGEVDGFTISPNAHDAETPMWIGGRTERSLRRAIEFGDGWVPFGLGDHELAAILDRHELPDDFDVVLWAHDLDPGGDPDHAIDQLSSRRALGATIANVRFRSQSLTHWMDQAQSLARLKF